jgi:hypothetical protein
MSPVSLERTYLSPYGTWAGQLRIPDCPWTCGRRLLVGSSNPRRVLMFKVDATGFMRGPGGVSSWSLVVGVLMQSPTNVCQMHMLGPTLTGFPVVALRNVNYPKGNNNCHELAMRPQGVLVPPSLPAFTVILLQHSNCPWYVPCQLPLFYSAQSRTSAWDPSSWPRVIEF